MNINEESSIDLAFVATAISNAIPMNNQQEASVNLALTSFKQLKNKFITFQNRKRKREKRCPIFWSYPRPDSSWLEQTLYDDGIPEEEFKK